MKGIPQNETGAQWDNSLLEDLSFIKRHLCYPFSKKTIPAVLACVIFFSFLLRMVWLFWFMESHVPVALKWGAIPFIIFIIFSGFYQYYRTLRFISIPTPFFLGDNMHLVEKFLQSQQLAVYRHPDGPEIFQILSRPFGNAETGRREVMIFIADDRRILVNSHYVNQKFTISPPSGNARLMARKLRDWLRVNYPDKNESAYTTSLRQVR